MNPQDFTIKQLISQLRIGQIWAILIALGTICSIFYLAGSWVGDAKVSERESQIASLQLGVDRLLLEVESSKKKAEELTIQVEEAKRELENVSFKEIFMSLYLNYIKEVEGRKTAHPPYEESDPIQSSEARNDLTSKVSEGRIYLTKLAKFIDKLVNSKEVTLKKGGPGQKSVVIFKDGTQWEVPSEVMDITDYRVGSVLERRGSSWDEGK
jgi:hypothetical protein